MKRAGFTFLEMMLVLATFSIVILTMTNLLLVVEKAGKIDHSIKQKDIFEIQFQYLVMTSHNFNLENNKLCYVQYKKDFCLIFENNRLVKTPGYEILMTDITEAFFANSDEAIVLSAVIDYQKEEMRFEKTKQ